MIWRTGCRCTERNPGRLRVLEGCSRSFAHPILPSELHDAAGAHGLLAAAFSRVHDRVGPTPPKTRIASRACRSYGPGDAQASVETRSGSRARTHTRTPFERSRSRIVDLSRSLLPKFDSILSASPTCRRDLSRRFDGVSWGQIQTASDGRALSREHDTGHSCSPRYRSHREIPLCSSRSRTHFRSRGRRERTRARESPRGSRVQSPAPSESDRARCTS